jgi:hypothetical protein
MNDEHFRRQGVDGAGQQEGYDNNYLNALPFHQAATMPLARSILHLSQIQARAYRLVKIERRGDFRTGAIADGESGLSHIK